MNPALTVRPRFSVIAPTRGRPAELARCLDALARLDYPRDGFEVIVVDDGSGAPPADVVERVCGRLHVRRCSGSARVSLVTKSGETKASSTTAPE